MIFEGVYGVGDMNPVARFFSMGWEFFPKKVW